MKAIDAQRDMVEFDIQILELANADGKKMLIYTSIKDLEASYVQQPVLRILAYLTEQMLPSFSPTSPGTEKQTPKNDIRP